MKKISIFILGFMVALGIVGVYAINASEINYSNTTVENA